MRDERVYKLTFSSIFLSVAIVLEYLFKVVVVFKNLNGGGISLAMLPLIVIGVVCGVKYGICAGIAFGLIDCFVIDGFPFNIFSFFLDYIFAFGFMGLAGIFRKKILNKEKKYFILSVFMVVLLRWISSGFSGVINANIWGYDQKFLEGLFGEGKGSILWLYFYSFIYYNLPYLLISGVLCIVIGLLSYKVLFVTNNDEFN